MRTSMGGKTGRLLNVKSAGTGVLALATLMLSGAADNGQAQSPNLEGSWSGGGSVSFSSGSKEDARCRASYQRRTAKSYTLRAVCATPSVRASQTATVRQVGSNRFEGSFYNSEYNVSGSIYIVVRGSSQNVRLTSSAGWAHFRLSR
jgi:hypothetical protein